MPVSGALAEVLPDWRLPTLDIYALVHPGWFTASRVRIFLDVLLDALAPDAAGRGCERRCSCLKPRRQLGLSAGEECAPRRRAGVK